MRANALTIYRRHTKSCSKGYEQNFRINHPQTPKEWKADCECPIVADGWLRNVPQRVQREGTGTNDWDVAEAQKTQWEAWGQYTDPNPAIVEDPTIAEAAEKYKADAITKNLESTTRQDIDQHLRLRLLPFCEAAKVSHVRFFDNARLVRDCVGSWKSVKTGKLLSPETRRAELERFRGFLSWCVAQRWLKENHAKAKDLSVRTEPIKGKFGMNPHEEERVFDAIGKLVDCYGRTGQRNAEETKAFCLVMRHTGLRISDVTKLDSSQLVNRAGGNGWAIQVMQQKKTKEFVRIPITTETADALHALPFKGERDGKKYWFYTGVGKMKTSVTTWRKRITTLIAVAQKDEKGQPRPFENHATPHTFRHTFSISHLNVGTEIKMVSRWLGHASVGITEKHYGHANRATHLASEAAYDESIRKQAESRLKEKKSVENVVSIANRKRT